MRSAKAVLADYYTTRDDEMATRCLPAVLMVCVVLALVCAVMSAEAPVVKPAAWDGKAGSKIGDVVVNPKDGAEMVWVPAGKFKMGTSEAEIAAMLKEHPDWKAESFADEQPQREVELDGYWMYKHEVTVAQYRKFCNATKREMPEAPMWGWKDDHPAVNITWQDAADYAKWAGVRLPTEAEWEKAARGADGRRYVWGNQWPPPKASANFADEALAKKEPKLVKLIESLGGSIIKNYDDGHAYTAPVGSFPAGASPCGCLDTAGNVCEWCADWYESRYYGESPSKNPQGPSKGENVEGLGQCRVLRGGTWFYFFPELLRAPFRFWSLPGDWNDGFGFRCAASAPGLQE